MDDNYILLQEIRTNGNIYKWDYESLANLPDLDKTFSEGSGISISKPSGSTSNVVSISQDILDKVNISYNKLYPSSLIITSTSGFGNYEYGDTVTPKVTWRFQNITSDLVIYPEIYSSGSWVPIETLEGTATSYEFTSPSVTTEYRIRATYNGSNLIYGPYTVTFGNYRYYGPVSELPAEINNTFLKSLESSDLSGSYNLSSTALGSGKYFIFAAPGEFTAIVRDAGTGGVIDQITGTTYVTRKNGTLESPIIYTWIIVPKSGISWNFKIEQGE